ncbi:MAG: thermonuclease family protein [Bacilli bacterium]|nr:thermonuclease family protein [Bacilli bacterium]
MNKKVWIGMIFLLLIMPFSVFAEKEEVRLVKCVDGDTARFMIGKKEYSTRFLAIDTPETKHPKKGVEPYGKEASNYTCSRLKKAKKIVLEYDPSSTKEDKYGRRLAWIFIDDELLQKQLVKKGYAKVAYLYGDYKYTNILKVVEKQAKIEKIGIWSNKEVRKESSSISIDKILKKIYQYIRKEIKSML